MTSKPVSALLADLGVTRSHSRPRVSNDIPYSEAQIKTLNYLSDFPTSFASLAHAREFCAGFFHEYNYIHRHSGIAWHTPAPVLFGTAGAIDQDRQNTLTAAYHTHPKRFGRLSQQRHRYAGIPNRGTDNISRAVRESRRALWTVPGRYM